MGKSGMLSSTSPSLCQANYGQGLMAMALFQESSMLGSFLSD